MDPTCYGESIYNLIPSDWKKPIPPPRYTSVFRTAIKDDIKKSKASMKTMGPAKVEVPSPKDFLKKHSKEKSLPPKKKFEWNEPRKPPVPQKTDHPIMGIQNEKNFININVTDVIMGVTKKHKAVYVDKRTGDKHDLETSGLIPKYINKKDYGTTPEYISKRNEEVKKAQQDYDNFIQESLRKAAMKRLSDDEREAVLQTSQGYCESHQEDNGLTGLDSADSCILDGGEAMELGSCPAHSAQFPSLDSPNHLRLTFLFLEAELVFLCFVSFNTESLPSY